MQENVDVCDLERLLVLTLDEALANGGDVLENLLAQGCDEIRLLLLAISVQGERREELPDGLIVQVSLDRQHAGRRPWRGSPCGREEVDEVRGEDLEEMLEDVLP